MLFPYGFFLLTYIFIITNILSRINDLFYVIGFFVLWLFLASGIHHHRHQHQPSKDKEEGVLFGFFFFLIFSM